MKVKVEFECEVYAAFSDPWFAVNDELKHTGLDYISNLEVTEIKEEK